MRSQRQTPSAIDLIRQMAGQAFSRSAGAPLTSGNAVELLFDSNENFPAWLSALGSARHSIMIEMYLFANDDFGRQVRALLIERARAGVHVYLLYDWLGSLGAHLSGFFAPLRQAGAEVRAFHPPSIGTGIDLLGRDHRKLIVVDGECAFISGLCISSRWQGAPGQGVPPWRDSGVRLNGPVVADTVAAFVDSWAVAGPPLDEKAAIRAIPETCGDVAARLIATTPATAHMMRLDLLIASFARQSLWLTDAYFVGTSLYLTALKQAARDGVDVRLLVPRSSDISLVAALSRTLYRPLLEAGVRVFEWNGPMIHAKTAVADGRWARIGSTNLNISSWLANRELDIALEDEGCATTLANRFLADLDNATEVVLIGQRRLPGLTRPRGRNHPPLLSAVAGGTALGASAAARQAARISDALGAVVRGTRTIDASEATAFLSIGLVLLAASLACAIFPYLVAAPLAAVLGLGGISVVWRALGLQLAKRRKKQHPPAPDAAVPPSEPPPPPPF
ncbi:phospholipase D-like domain-containing protein [Paludibacterium yongneupense]|uniref:phospholipase D-like domain-containing protein n=1 Tax=Paludibacterium yongneupense TaxID=400061 RepID=UPI00040E132A|nr:phospholipase D-like domain-containing protein [Paludibacterium yongneupense]